MILLDYSQVGISNAAMALNNSPSIEGEVKKLNPDIARFMVLNSIRMYVNNFSKEYGEMVIAVDGGNCWRKDIFKEYKGMRKSDKEKSSIDWDDLHQVLNMVIDEIKRVFHYPVIHYDKAEADDVIAVLCDYTQSDAEIMTNQNLIISGDKDFQQLQKFKNVAQFAPVQKKYIICDNPRRFLKEQILRGDSGDGVPNFLSPNNCFVSKTRQKPLLAKKVEEYIKQHPAEFCTTSDLHENYERNRTMIDFEKIPKDIYDEIVRQYQLPRKPVNYNKIKDYFVEKGLNQFQQKVNEFI